MKNAYSNIPKLTIVAKWDKANPEVSERITIDSAERASEVLRAMFNSDTFCWQEEMILLCLNNSKDVTAVVKISTGGLTESVCDPRVIFTHALLSGATSIIIAHNHPSGVLRPSTSDDKITKTIQAAGKLLRIELVDHIILTEHDYYSYAVNDCL